MWLLGVSGVGKRAFASKLESEDSLRKAVGIDAPLGFVDARRRDEPYNEQLEELGQAYGDVVIKWQFKANCWLECLPRIHPTLAHQIVRLHRRHEDILRSRPDLTQEKLLSEEKRIDDLVRRVARLYVVMDVDANDWTYRVVGSASKSSTYV